MNVPEFCELLSRVRTDIVYENYFELKVEQNSCSVRVHWRRLCSLTLCTFGMMQLKMNTQYLI